MMPALAKKFLLIPRARERGTSIRRLIGGHRRQQEKEGLTSVLNGHDRLRPTTSRILSALCPSDLVSSISLFLVYAPSLKRREVPDPYHGGGRGFEVVLDLVEAASSGLLSHIRSYDL